MFFSLTTKYLALFAVAYMRMYIYLNQATRPIRRPSAPAEFFFPGVGKLGGLETKVLQRSPGVEPRWRSGGTVPRSRQKLWK